MAIFNENLINQWWDRTSEARLRDRHAREEKEAKKSRKLLSMMSLISKSMA